MHTNNNHINGDMSSIFLIALNWMPIVLNSHPLANDILQGAALVLGGLASLAVIVDHGMKIHWKIKQIRKPKKEDNHE